VRIDLDPPAIAITAARMSGQPVEVQEDLVPVLSLLLLPVDMRGAVIVALDRDVAVGVECGDLPFPTGETPRPAAA